MKRGTKTAYLPPAVETVSARRVIEALGPVSAGSAKQDDEYWGSNGFPSSPVC